MKTVREGLQNIPTKKYLDRKLLRKAVVFTMFMFISFILTCCSKSTQNKTSLLNDIAQNDEQIVREVFYTKRDSLYEHVFWDNKKNLLYKKDKSVVDSSMFCDAQYSPDGKYLYFIDRHYPGAALKVIKNDNTDGSVSSTELKDRDKESDKHDNDIIASDVDFFDIFDNGDILYKTISEGLLYIYNDGKAYQISENVGDYFFDEDIILFCTKDDVQNSLSDGESYNTGTLYYYDLKKNERGREKIQDGILTGSVKYTTDLKSVYYIKKEGDKQALYCIKGIKESSAGAPEVNLVARGTVINMNVDFNTDMLYYQIEENDERLYDIFIDDNTTV